MEATITYTLSNVLARVDEERSWWNDVLESNKGDMTAPGLAGYWSFKDVVDHLNIWLKRDVDELIAARHGTERPGKPWPAEIEAIPDKDQRVEHINEWYYQEHKGSPVDDVIRLSRALFDRLYVFVGESSEEDLNDPARFPSLEGKSLGQAIISGSLFTHFHDEHGDDIQKWIDSSG